MTTIAKIHNNNLVPKIWLPKLKLPQEHGATVAFACSSLLALIVAKDNALAIFITIAMLWIIFLSWDHPKQLIVMTSLACVILLFTKASYLSIALMVLFPVVGWCFLKNVFSIKAELRECVGMLGAANVPILAALLISHNTYSALLAACAITASTLASTGLIRFRVSRSWNKVSLCCTLAALAWIVLFILVPDIAFYCSFPFVFFRLWLMRQESLNFKILGIASALCALLTTLVVILEILKP